MALNNFFSSDNRAISPLNFSASKGRPLMTHWEQDVIFFEHCLSAFARKTECERVKSH